MEQECAARGIVQDDDEQGNITAEGFKRRVAAAEDHQNPSHGHTESVQCVTAGQQNLREDRPTHASKC